MAHPDACGGGQSIQHPGPAAHHWARSLIRSLILIVAAERHVAAALGTLLLAGIVFIFVQNLTNALTQLRVPDHLRGRLMSVFSLVFFGLMPIGSLAIGITAHYFGEPVAVGISASAYLLMAILVWKFAPGVRTSP